MISELSWRLHGGPFQLSQGVLTEGNASLSNLPLDDVTDDMSLGMCIWLEWGLTPGTRKAKNN